MTGARSCIQTQSYHMSRTLLVCVLPVLENSSHSSLLAPDLVVTGAAFPSGTMQYLAGQL